MFARTPDYAANRGIGIPPDRTYKITRSVDTVIDACGLPAAGERLLHILIHEACKAKDRRVPGRDDYEDGQLRLSCKLIRGRLGLNGSTDNRAILRGLESLQANGFFADVEILHGGLVLQWSFIESFEHILFDDDTYGLFDIDDVHRLQGPLQLWLHRKLGIVWRMRRPVLDFSVTDLLLATGQQQSPSWTSVSRQLIGALNEVARKERARFLVFGWWKGDLAGIDRVTIRIEHGQTKWQRNALGKVPLSTKKIYLVDQTGRVILAAASDVLKMEAFRPYESPSPPSIAA
jgi:hypothetical protein